MFSGRRGTKRKAEVQAEEEKPSLEEKKERAELDNDQNEQRVVIEHWWVTYFCVAWTWERTETSKCSLWCSDY